MVDLVLASLDIEDADQVSAALALVSADEIGVVGFTEETAETFRVRLAHPDSLVEGNRLAWRDGSPVGVLLVEMDRHGRDVFLDAYAPVPDRTDVMRALLDDGLATARAIARADAWHVEGGCYGQDEEYASALSLTGFTAVRRFWRMRQGLAGMSSTEPPTPPGVTRRIVSGEDDRRSLHALFTTSFAEHFGTSNDRPFEEWIASVEAAPGVDPERWWIASLDGVDVGLCILDGSRAALGCGYVRTLGVIPDARGRGVARWLLGCAAADAVARGHSELMLTVDGENTTGATALYESVGYRIDEVIDLWRQPVGGAVVRDSADSR